MSEHFAVIYVLPEKEKLDELGELEGSACSREMDGTLLSCSLYLCLSCRFLGMFLRLEKPNGK